MTDRDTAGTRGTDSFLPMIRPPSTTTLRQYGLEAAEWWELLEAQDDRCPICAKRFTLLRPPVIDHAHRTGIVRGLLCRPCNDTIGRLHEDIAWLWNAFTYLTSPPAYRVFDIPHRHVDAPPED